MPKKSKKKTDNKKLSVQILAFFGKKLTSTRLKCDQLNLITLNGQYNTCSFYKIKVFTLSIFEHEFDRGDYNTKTI